MLTVWSSNCVFIIVGVVQSPSNVLLRIRQMQINNILNHEPSKFIPRRLIVPIHRKISSNISGVFNFHEVEKSNRRLVNVHTISYAIYINWYDFLLTLY